jgi:hypothetical protein
MRCRPGAHNAEKQKNRNKMLPMAPAVQVAATAAGAAMAAAEAGEADKLQARAFEQGQLMNRVVAFL